MLRAKNGSYKNAELVALVTEAMRNNMLFDSIIVKRIFVAAPLPIPPNTLQSITAVPDTAFDQWELIVVRVNTYANLFGSTYQCLDNLGVNWFDFTATNNTLVISKTEWNSADYQFAQLYSNTFLNIFSIDTRLLSL